MTSPLEDIKENNWCKDYYQLKKRHDLLINKYNWAVKRNKLLHNKNHILANNNRLNLTRFIVGIYAGATIILILLSFIL